jgi:NAD(P)-dependent dehydrogenase (short-subunit alcohol dehydrogenase family)
MSINPTESTILMTGATSGLGKVAALSLAKNGHQLIILARNSRKADELVAACGEWAKNIDVIPCDLSSLTEVRNAIDHVKVHYQKLDMLINNAGLWNTKQIKTVDGIEQTWQVNLLVPYLLMKEFQPLLALSKSPKIINTASALHSGTINFKDIEFNKSFNGFKAYRQSKLGVILITRYLATRWDIPIYAQHPGLVRTDLGRSFGWLFVAIFKLMGISPEEGAQNLLYLTKTSSEDLKSGEYYAKQKIQKITKESYDLSEAKRLCDTLEHYLEN